MISRRTLFMALPAISSFSLGTAFAQNYPQKPVKIIVPIAPGTATDGAARHLANGLGPLIGGTVVVENKMGGDGMIAGDFVAKSPPDGYTLLAAIAPHYINYLLKTAPYHPVNDFEPILQYGRTPVVLLTSAGSPLRSFRDVIENAKQKPGELSYATAASSTAMAASLVETMAGVKFRRIPYTSSPQAVVDTVSGVVDLTFAGVAAALPLVRSGRVRALGATWKSSSLPEVPTFSELGLTGYDCTSPNWIFAPRGTPAAIIERLSDGLVRVASTPEFKQFALLQGFEVDVLPAAAVKAGATKELEKWGRLVTLSNLKPG